MISKKLAPLKIMFSWIMHGNPTVGVGRVIGDGDSAVGGG